MKGPKHTKLKQWLLEAGKESKRDGAPDRKDEGKWGELIFVVFFYFIFQAARLTSAPEPRPPLWHPLRRLRLLLRWWNLRSPRRTSWISLPKWAHQTVVTVNTAMPAPCCPSSASQAVSSHWYSAYQGRMYHFTYNRQTETVCEVSGCFDSGPQCIIKSWLFRNRWNWCTEWTLEMNKIIATHEFG